MNKEETVDKQFDLDIDSSDSVSISIKDVSLEYQIDVKLEVYEN